MSSPGIPTLYKNIRFRSRLEATWAIFFDRVGLAWSYEPIDLAGYIPDFLVEVDSAGDSTWEELRAILEVKPAFSLEGLTAHAPKIERAGWYHEAILVGTEPVWQDAGPPVFGLDGRYESVLSPPPREWPGPGWRYTWQPGYLGACNTCGRPSIIRQSERGHAAPECLIIDDEDTPCPGKVVPFGRDTIAAAWHAAKNEAQWLPTAPAEPARREVPQPGLDEADSAAWASSRCCAYDFHEGLCGAPTTGYDAERRGYVCAMHLGAPSAAEGGPRRLLYEEAEAFRIAAWNRVALPPSRRPPEFLDGDADAQCRECGREIEPGEAVLRCIIATATKLANGFVSGFLHLDPCYSTKITSTPRDAGCRRYVYGEGRRCGKPARLYDVSDRSWYCDEHPPWRPGSPPLYPSPCCGLETQRAMDGTERRACPCGRKHLP